MAQLSSRPLDREPLLVFQDPLRAENDTSHFSPSPVFNDPIASVNAATAQTVCYNCGKLGHFSTDCRSIRKTERYNQQSPGNEVFGTFRARIGQKKGSQKQKQPSANPNRMDKRQNNSPTSIKRPPPSTTSSVKPFRFCIREQIGVFRRWLLRPLELRGISRLGSNPHYI